MTAQRPANLTAVLMALMAITLVGCASTSSGLTDAASADPTVTSPTTTSASADRPGTQSPPDEPVATEPAPVTTPSIESAPVDSPPADSPPIISSVLDELSPEDDLAFNPPAPENVRAGQVTAASAELIWSAPAPVAVPHSYSDRVVAYRIYRNSDDEIELRPLDTTAELVFVDQSVESGRTYHYAVTSIRDMNVEGTKSYPTVTISVP